MELGQLITDNSEKLMQLGLVHAVSKDMNDGLIKAEELLQEYTSMPPIARHNAKLKGRNPILAQMTEYSMEGVVNSICGKEFQSTAEKVLNKKV